jgi:hypothetical protein
METNGLDLPNLEGTPKQIKWAIALRDKAITFIWEMGWYGSFSELEKDARRLPASAEWWIDNRCSGRCHEAAREYLGLEYRTPAGADY